MDLCALLEKKFQDKTARVGVVGLGYVGLPVATAFCRAGLEVYGFDEDHKKLDMLINGQSYLSNFPPSNFYPFIQEYRFNIAVTPDWLGKCDAILICVPTPLTDYKEPLMELVKRACDTIHRYLRRGQIIVLESTVFPSATRELVIPRVLRESKLEPGKDVFFGFSPEREDPGNESYSLANTPKVVSGSTEACLKVVSALYRTVCSVVPVSSLEVAETTKLLENTYRAVNIALINEFKLACQAMNIDVWDVIRAAKTKPYGFQAFYPGCGYGGACLPKDARLFSWKAKQYDCSTKFIDLASEINYQMPWHIFHAIGKALNEKSQAVRGSNILLLGVAYKKNINDIRDSPALRLRELLIDHGANVHYHDPYVPELACVESGRSIALTPTNLKKQDCVVIATDHSDVNYMDVLENAKLVIDTKGVYQQHPKVVRA